MQPLKVDVANTVTIGPALAVGDGFVPVTNLIGASADEYEIIKHGATTTTGISAALAAITGADGYYSLVLSAAEISDEGRLTLIINDDSLILPIRHEFVVLPVNVFDSFYTVAGTDLLQVDQTQIAGTTVPTPATAGIPDVNVREWLDNVVAAAAAGVPNVNVTTFLNIAVAAATASGEVNVNVREWLEAAVAAATAGRPDVNAVRWNNGLIPAQNIVGVPEVDMTHIAGVAKPATQLSKSADTMDDGTASGTPTTTTMVSDIGITVDNQYNGKSILFADDTTTAALQKQATKITGGTASSNTLIFVALTTAPVSGDTFSIV